jgi:hypothetical protein
MVDVDGMRHKAKKEALSMLNRPVTILTNKFHMVHITEIFHDSMLVWVITSNLMPNPH